MTRHNCDFAMISVVGLAFFLLYSKLSDGSGFFRGPRVAQNGKALSDLNLPATLIPSSLENAIIVRK